MARGRPRKAGARNKSGRLKVPADPKIERPSEWVRGQFARFGQDYNSALGRAYAAGLLGEGAEAKNRYDTARKLISLYRRIIGKDRYGCATRRRSVLSRATRSDERCVLATSKSAASRRSRAQTRE